MMREEGFEPVEQTHMMQQLLSALESVSNKFDTFARGQTGHTNKFIEEMTKQSVNAMDAVTNSSLGHLRKYLEEVEKIAEDTSKHVTSHVSAVFRNIDIMNEKVNRPSSSNGGAIAYLEKFKGVASEFATLTVQVAPQLALFTSLVATMTQLSGQTSSLHRTMGGSQERLSLFTDMIGGVAASSRLAASEIVELGKSFQQEGIFLSQHTPELREYLKTSAEVVKMIGLSSSTAAQFARNQIVMGRTSKEVANNYDELYKGMQKYQLTVDDLADSIMTANHLFSSFAMTSGKGVEGLAKELLETKGLLRSLGEDGKNAGNILAQELGNVQLRTQHAGFIAALTGSDMASNFNLLGTAQGERMKRIAALTGVQNMVGASALFADPSQLSQAQQMNRTVRIGGAVDSISQMLGVAPGDLQKELAEYSIAKRKNPSLTISGFFDKKAAEQRSKEPSKSWQDANAGFNSSFAETGKQFQHLLQDLMIILGGPMVKILTPLLQGLNFLLDGFIELQEKNPIVKMITEFAVLGVTMGALMGPIRLIGGALKLGAKAFPMLAEGAAAFGTWLKTMAPNMASFGLNPTMIATVAIPVLSLYFDKLENFFTNFIPRWIKGLWDGFTQSDIGKKISGVAGNLGHGVAEFAKNPLKAIGDLLMPPAAASTLHPTMAAISDVVRKGTSPATKMLLGGVAHEGPGGNAGWLSAMMEGHSDPGTVSSQAMRAYGAWQMDHKFNTPQKFLKWIGKHRNTDIDERLTPLLGSIKQQKQGAFGQEWMKIGKERRQEFLDLQRDFIKAQYLQPLLNKYPHALSDSVLQEVALSTSVHHGVGGASNILKRAGIGGDLSPDQLIHNIYAQRGEVTTSSPYHKSFVNRFAREEKAALSALGSSETNKILKSIDDKLDRNHKYRETRDKENKKDSKVASAMGGDASYLHNKLRNNVT